MPHIIFHHSSLATPAQLITHHLSIGPQAYLSLFGTNIFSQSRQHQVIERALTSAASKPDREAFHMPATIHVQADNLTANSQSQDQMQRSSTFEVVFGCCFVIGPPETQS
jgi:hypothetical protein